MPDLHLGLHELDTIVQYDIEARHGSTLNGGLCKPIISLQFRVGILNKQQSRGKSKRFSVWHIDESIEEQGSLWSHDHRAELQWVAGS